MDMDDGSGGVLFSMGDSPEFRAWSARLQAHLVERELLLQELEQVVRADRTRLREAQIAAGDYTADEEGTPYTGIDNLQPGLVYAQAADLNALRAAVENLRVTVENLLASFD